MPYIIEFQLYGGGRWKRSKNMTEDGRETLDTKVFDDYTMALREAAFQQGRAVLKKTQYRVTEVGYETPAPPVPPLMSSNIPKVENTKMILNAFAKKVAAQWEMFDIAATHLNRINLWGPPGVGKTFGACALRNHGETRSISLS